MGQPQQQQQQPAEVEETTTRLCIEHGTAAQLRSSIARLATSEERFALIAAAQEVTAMRSRWRCRLLDPLSNYRSDGFQWDDARPLTDFPGRLPHIIHEISFETRKKAGNTDWCEALPRKVLLCTHPAVMLRVQFWDRPITPYKEPRPPPDPTIQYVNALGAGGQTPAETLLNTARMRLRDISKTPPPVRAHRPPRPPVVVAELGFVSGGRANTDRVGCHLRKPCIMIDVHKWA